MFADKTILLGVTGGIASYRSIELANLLSKRGAKVKVVMTESATKFVTPLTFRTITRNPVALELFDSNPNPKIHHISLADEADLILVAPATANFINKLASGLADDLLMTTVLASTAPLLIAPAMNTKMYQNPITASSIERLKSLGHDFVGPAEGELACGALGPGRLAPLDEIVEAAEFLLSRGRDLLGKKILVTAGATREAIDPVRYISNRSSGKMGFEIARELIARGAVVTLISGHTSIKPPEGSEVVLVETAAEMETQVKANFLKSDALIMAAAVSDYRPKTFSEEKIKKDKEEIDLTLVKTTDILSSIKNEKGKRVIIAFSAETEKLIENSLKKLKAKGADLIVCNDVSRTDIGFESDLNEVTLIDDLGDSTLLPLSHKRVIARGIVDRLVEMIS